MLKPEFASCGARESQDNTIVDLGNGLVVPIGYAKWQGLLELVDGLIKSNSAMSERLHNLRKMVFDCKEITTGETKNTLLALKDCCRVVTVDAMETLDTLLDIEAFNVIEE